MIVDSIDRKNGRKEKANTVENDTEITDLAKQKQFKLYGIY